MAGHDDVLVEVNGVSKKFSRSLKRSLWYGLNDLTVAVLGSKKERTELRPDEFWAVKDVSFQLKRGECLGLIGHNGAGKSTLLKILNGLIRPDEGEIVMRGRVGALIELGAGFNPVLSGRENVYINGQILGFSKKEIDEKFDSIVEFSELGKFIDMPVQNYSSGMKVRLGFAVAAQMEPDVLIIDEVLAVGDLGFRIKCLNRINELIANTCVIYVSHSMPQVSRICTKGILLNAGNVRYSSEDIGSVIDAYFSLFAIEKQSNVGSGKANFERLRFVQGSNTNSAQEMDLIELDTKLPLIIEGVLKVEKSIQSIDIKFFVINKETRPVMDIPSNYSGSTITNKGANELKVHIPGLPLNKGDYMLSAVVLDANTGERLLRLENIIKLRVKHPYLSWMDTVIQADWAVKAAI